MSLLAAGSLGFVIPQASHWRIVSGQDLLCFKTSPSLYSGYRWCCVSEDRSQEESMTFIDSFQLQGSVHSVRDADGQSEQAGLAEES